VTQRKRGSRVDMSWKLTRVGKVTELSRRIWLKPSKEQFVVINFRKFREWTGYRGGAMRSILHTLNCSW
jgi:hypothetical protein